MHADFEIAYNQNERLAKRENLTATLLPPANTTTTALSCSLFGNTRFKTWDLENVTKKVTDQPKAAKQAFYDDDIMIMWYDDAYASKIYVLLQQNNQPKRQELPWCTLCWLSGWPIHCLSIGHRRNEMRNDLIFSMSLALQKMSFEQTYTYKC